MKHYEQTTLQREIRAQTEVTPSQKGNQALGGSTSRSLSMRRLVQKHTGGSIIVAVTLGTILLWLLFWPAGQPVRTYLGEICGITAIVLFSFTLVLATRIHALEPYFGGLDRMYVWHRFIAVIGAVLLVPHVYLTYGMPNPFRSQLSFAFGALALFGVIGMVLWSMAPRLPLVSRYLSLFTNYQCWVTPHRLTGLFVIFAFIHSALLDPTLRHSAVLLWWYVAIGVLGSSAYLYREVLTLFLLRGYDYTVDSVRWLNQTTLGVVLAPVAAPLAYEPGQFVFVAFGRSASWERHPFTVSSSPQDRHLHLVIKTLGDYTQQLYETLQPGVPASVGEAFGMFDYRQGRSSQVWIAGGIGITPFRSWIRSLPEALAFDIDFYYTVRTPEDALFLGEIEHAARRHPSFRPHIRYSKRDGSLTAEYIVATSSGAIANKDVYMCGPTPLIKSFQRALRKLGVPSNHIHFEHFNFR